MANIHVEPRKKEGNGYLIWIIVLLLLIAAAVVYYFTVRTTANHSTATPAGTTGCINLLQPAFIKELL
jgi:flagellar basal body-associated protein FliL